MAERALIRRRESRAEVALPKLPLHIPESNLVFAAGIELFVDCEEFLEVVHRAFGNDPIGDIKQILERGGIGQGGDGAATEGRGQSARSTRHPRHTHRSDDVALQGLFVELDPPEGQLGLDVQLSSDVMGNQLSAHFAAVETATTQILTDQRIDGATLWEDVERLIEIDAGDNDPSV